MSSHASTQIPSGEICRARVVEYMVTTIPQLWLQLGDVNKRDLISLLNSDRFSLCPFNFRPTRRVHVRIAHQSKKKKKKCTYHLFKINHTFFYLYTYLYIFKFLSLTLLISSNAAQVYTPTTSRTSDVTRNMILNHDACDNTQVLVKYYYYLSSWSVPRRTIIGLLRFFVVLIRLVD